MAILEFVSLIISHTTTMNVIKGQNVTLSAKSKVRYKVSSPFFFGEDKVLRLRKPYLLHALTATVAGCSKFRFVFGEIIIITFRGCHGFW